MTSIDQRLTLEQERAAAEVLAKGVALKGTYDRPNKKELDRQIEEIVRRVSDILEEKLSPSLRDRLTDILSNFAIGLMAAAAWDLMKVYVPFLHNMFMAAEPTDYMRRVAAWEQETNSALPPGMRDFASKNEESLKALRAQVYGGLRDRLESSELSEVLDPLLLRDISETFESRLFVRVRL